MAIGTSLPPQAYTRETLTQAFNWLQSQPEHVKRLAPNPDALVALYIRTQRYGNSGDTEAPVSSQAFISDLKHLAEGLKQFEQPAPLTPAASSGNVSQTTRQPTINHAAPAPRTSVNAAVNSGSLVETLHPNSQAMVQQIREQFNLNSETEVMNMMVTIAYKSLKNLI